MGMPRLSFRSGDHPASHEVADETVTIGRGPDNQIVLDDPSVSGRHAELRRVGNGYHLRDLGSTNGTRLNDETITDVALRAGDRIRFGKVEARYEADPAEGAQPLPEAEEIAIRPAETSARPDDFVNASPFPPRSKNKDPLRPALLAAAAIALLAFLASMIAVFQISAPPTP